MKDIIRLYINNRRKGMPRTMSIQMHALNLLYWGCIRCVIEHTPSKVIFKYKDYNRVLIKAAPMRKLKLVNFKVVKNTYE